MSNRLIGYQSGQGFLYDLSGASKMLFFILVSVACMATYDPRFILAVGLLSIYLFYLAKIRWRDISFVVKIIGSIALFNLLFSSSLLFSIGILIVFFSPLVLHPRTKSDKVTHRIPTKSFLPITSSVKLHFCHKYVYIIIPTSIKNFINVS